MADILRPELLWIEGRCYRINDPITEVSELQELDSYDNVTMDSGDLFDEGDNNEFDITMVDNSRYTTSFHVSKHYIGSIIGKKGATKIRIERDTKTDIKIPKQGQDGDVVIFGPSASNVSAARRRINIIVTASRMKQKPTHFISIPMNHPDIVKSFEQFKESVLRECPSQGLDESIFIAPLKLHLTFGVMCLMDNQERLFASKLLTEAKDKVIRPLLQGHLPLKIRVKGLSYMNDDPEHINVLYGNVEEEGNSKGVVQRLGDALVDYFYKAGFMKKEFGRENIKLHVTLINSRYRSGSASTNEDAPSWRHRPPPRETFDGTEVLRKFADYDFGISELESVHLSQMHCLGPDGYYQSTYVVSFDDIK